MWIYLPRPVDLVVQDHERNHSARFSNHQGASRLLQLLIAESIHLIWVWYKTEHTARVRSKHVGSKHQHEADRRQDHDHGGTNTKRVTSTWGPILSSNADLPNNWLSNRKMQVVSALSGRPSRVSGCGLSRQFSDLVCHYGRSSQTFCLYYWIGHLIPNHQ